MTFFDGFFFAFLGRRKHQENGACAPDGLPVFSCEEPRQAADRVLIHRHFPPETCHRFASFSIEEFASEFQERVPGALTRRRAVPNLRVLVFLSASEEEQSVTRQNEFGFGAI